MDKFKVAKDEKDALEEAGNIAAAYAVSALSKLIGENVKLDLTKCKLTKTEEIPFLYGGWKNMVVAVNMLIPTKNLCTVLMLLPVESAFEYCDLFSRNNLGKTEDISYKEIVVLIEIGNICICAYLNALSKLLNQTYVPTPPAVACDMIGSILEDVAVSADAINNEAMLLETEFIHNSGQLKSRFLFIPDRDSKDAILKVFNVKN